MCQFRPQGPGPRPSVPLPAALRPAVLACLVLAAPVARAQQTVGTSQPSSGQGSESVSSSTLGSPLAPATEDDSGIGAGEWLPWLLLAANVGAALGGIEAAGWPLEDATARIGIGFAAGGLPAVLVGWLWGEPCDEDSAFDVGGDVTSCVLEAFLEVLVIAAVDLGAAIPAMYYLPHEPDRPAISDGVASAWSLSFILGAPLLGIGTFALFGLDGADTTGGKAGLIAWGQSALATGLLGMIYWMSEAPVDGWSVQLPLLDLRL